MIVAEKGDILSVYVNPSRLTPPFLSPQALFTLYNFQFPLTVTLLQMAVIVPVTFAVAKPKLDWGLARAFLPLSLVNVLNVVSGLMGAPYSSHPAVIQRDSPRCFYCQSYCSRESSILLLLLQARQA